MGKLLYADMVELSAFVVHRKAMVNVNGLVRLLVYRFPKWKWEMGNFSKINDTKCLCHVDGRTIVFCFAFRNTFTQSLASIPVGYLPDCDAI